MDMIDDLMHEDHMAGLPEWTGMPLGQLVTDYHHPDELDAAWRRWVEVNGTHNSIFLSKMWHRSYCTPHMEIGEHSLDLYDVDLRCAAGAHESRKIGDPLGRLCQCVGDITAQIICSRCSWIRDQPRTWASELSCRHRPLVAKRRDSSENAESAAAAITSVRLRAGVVLLKALTVAWRPRSHARWSSRRVWSSAVNGVVPRKV
ncbi:DUF6349 family protein [Microbacterium sp. SL62]|nr:DUF6349 family protein [Microbacterium sp. SL62]